MDGAPHDGVAHHDSAVGNGNTITTDDNNNDNDGAINSNDQSISTSSNNIMDDDNKNNNNNDVIDFEESAEEPETQESFTQHEMTQNGNELTQMGLFDDDDGNDCNDDDDTNSRQPMIDPLTLPWGRLMPVGSNGVTLAPSSAAGGDDNTTVNASNISSSAATVAANNTALRPSTREAIEMLPRSPETRTVTTRSRSPSSENPNTYNSQNEEGVTFLGLKNLLPGDRFNEYLMGRSAKVSAMSSALMIIIILLTLLF